MLVATLMPESAFNIFDTRWLGRWTYRLRHCLAVYGAKQALRVAAMIAAVMAFASWLSRPITNFYVMRLGLEAIDLPLSEELAEAVPNPACDVEDAAGRPGVDRGMRSEGAS